VTREVAVSALREWAARQGVSGSVPVSWLGKLKTTLQMLAILLLLVGGEVGGVDIHGVGVGVLVVAALLSVWSLVEYLQLARRLIATAPMEMAIVGDVAHDEAARLVALVNALP